MARRRDSIDEALRLMLPGLPPFDRAAILDHAMDSPGLRAASPQAAAWLSAVAWIRHTYTDYDTLLADGYDVDSARHFVLDDINAVLAAWGCRRRIDHEDESGAP